MTFIQILRRSNSEIQDDRARRIAKGVYRAGMAYTMNLEEKRDNILNVIEASKDFSTSNSRDSLNAIDHLDAKSWFEKYHKNHLELVKVEEELTAAQKIMEDLFGPDKFDEDSGELLVKDPAPKKAKKK